ncbi:MAG: CRISPR-associated endonuclease Cas2 [Promethearchaeota archaeon]
MKFLIIYDIPIEHDPIRTKISKLLLSYNLIRLNYSVFYGDLTYNLAENIAIKLEKLVKNISGDVRIFPICNSCEKKIIVVKSKFESGFNIIKDLLSL